MDRSMTLPIICRDNIKIQGALFGNADVTIFINGQKAVLNQSELTSLIIALCNFRSETDRPQKEAFEKPTYEQVLELKYEYETEMYHKPRLVFSKVFKHKTSGETLTSKLLLYSCGIDYTPEKFREYLAKRSIPVKYMLAMNKFIDQNYEEFKPTLDLK